MTREKQNWGKTPWTIRFRAKTKRLPKRVDIAIVGGGFTGLAAAAMVKRLAPGKSVLLLEAGRVGHGASGRTGGMALSETAAGDLPGLGNVLQGYREILKELDVKADLDLPGVWEVARGNQSMEGKTVRPLKSSPIDWNDSGRVRAVGRVPGGTVDPGKAVSGLARAAVRAGVQIVENAEVFKMEFSDPVRLHVRRNVRSRAQETVIAAEKVLLATNAGSLELAGEIFGAKDSAEPKLTFAIATAPLSKTQTAELGLSSGRPFYTVDLPYLWGRLLKNRGMIFGSGLVPAFGESLRNGANSRKAARSGMTKVWSGLEQFDVRKGDAAARIRALEKRVRQLHPVLKKVRITHRWGGPILITNNFLPVFRCLRENKNVIALGGYSGHGVALSVYLGKWAAQVLNGTRSLPKWNRL